MIEERDFVGLGLAEHVQQKIFTNLVLRGYLDGRRPRDRARPAAVRGRSSALAGDFDAVRETVFELIGGLCRDDGRRRERRPSSRRTWSRWRRCPRPSGAELYDNLVFNRYLDTGRHRPVDGVLHGAGERRRLLGQRRPRCGGAGGVAAAAGPGRRVRQRPGTRWTPRSSRICGSPRRASTAWWRTSASTATSTASGDYVDKRALLALAADGLEPRAGVLPAPPGDPGRDAGPARRAPDAGLHDVPRGLRRHRRPATLAARILAELEGTYLADGRVPRRRRRARPLAGGGPLGLWLDLDAAAEATICGRVAAVLVEQQPYHLDRAALADLGLGRRRGRPAGRRADAGRGSDRGPGRARRTASAYFLDLRHALDYTVEGFERLLHGRLLAAARRGAGARRAAPPRSSRGWRSTPATQRRDVPRRAAGRARHPGRDRRGGLPCAVRRRRGCPGRPAGAGPRRGRRGRAGRGRARRPPVPQRCTGGWRGSPCWRRSSA